MLGVGVVHAVIVLVVIFFPEEPPKIRTETAHIALATDGGHEIGLIAVIRSVIQSTRTPHLLFFHILSTADGSVGRQRIEALLACYGLHVGQNAGLSLCVSVSSKVFVVL